MTRPVRLAFACLACFLLLLPLTLEKPGLPLLLIAFGASAGGASASGAGASEAVPHAAAKSVTIALMRRCCSRVAMAARRCQSVDAVGRAVSLASSCSMTKLSQKPSPE